MRGDFFFFLYKIQKTSYKVLSLFLICSKIFSISVDGDNTVKLYILCHTKLNNILIFFWCEVNKNYEYFHMLTVLY